MSRNAMLSARRMARTMHLVLLTRGEWFTYSSIQQQVLASCGATNRYLKALVAEGLLEQAKDVDDEERETDRTSFPPRATTVSTMQH